MAEPISSSAVTLASTVTAAAAVPALTILGISTGVRLDFVLAGFSGSLVAIVLLNSVPSSGDTWRHMIGTAVRRMAIAGASALLAGYLAPALIDLAGIPERMAMAVAFVAGAGAQRVLQAAMSRLNKVTEDEKPS